jgi:hypothetical protein
MIMRKKKGRPQDDDVKQAKENTELQEKTGITE